MKAPQISAHFSLLNLLTCLSLGIYSIMKHKYYWLKFQSIWKHSFMSLPLQRYLVTLHAVSFCCFIFLFFFSPGPCITAEQVVQYLKEHPQVLDEYLMQHVELETLERYMIRRSQRDKQQSNGSVEHQNLPNSEFEILTNNKK